MSIRDAIQRAEANDQIITPDEFQDIVDSAIQTVSNIPPQNLNEEWSSLAQAHFRNDEDRMSFLLRLNEGVRNSTLSFFRDRSENIPDALIERIGSNVDPSGRGVLNRPYTIFQRDSRLCDSGLGFLCLPIAAGEALSGSTRPTNLEFDLRSLLPRGVRYLFQEEGIQLLYGLSQEQNSFSGPQIRYTELAQILYRIENRRHNFIQAQHDRAMYQLYTRDEYFSLYTNFRLGYLGASYFGGGVGILLRMGESAHTNQRFRHMFSLALAYQGLSDNAVSAQHHFFDAGISYEFFINSGRSHENNLFTEPPRAVWRLSAGAEVMTNFSSNPIIFYTPIGVTDCFSRSLCLAFQAGPAFTNGELFGALFNLSLQYRPLGVINP